MTGEFLWQRIERLWELGLDEYDIAERLGIPADRVRANLFNRRQARAKRRAEVAPPLAERMADAYPDAERQDWMRRQVKQWEARRMK